MASKRIFFRPTYSFIIIFSLIVFLTSFITYRMLVKRQPTSLCPNCNVILVSLDTLSANHLSCYGYDRDTAPRLCQFAKDNIFFTHMYANSYYTLPSHVSIFTGRYAGSHRVNLPFQDRLDPAIPFLPEILHENGYYIHFGMPATDRNLPISLVYNRGIDTITPPDDDKPLWTEDLELFRQKVKSGQKTFMFLHTYAVHAPYLIQGEKMFSQKQFPDIPVTLEQYKDCSTRFIGYMRLALKVEIERNESPEQTLKYQKLATDFAHDDTAIQACSDPRNDGILDSFRYNFMYSKDNINSPEKVQYVKDLYDQKIVELDQKLAPLFSLMKDGGIRKNTILIITADHGEEFMEHNYLTHKTLYDSNVRIPLFVYVPDLAKRTLTSVTESVDIAPTILDLIGIKGSYRFQGVSLVKEILGKGTGKGYAIAEHAGLKIKTIRDNSYKLFTKEESGNFIPYELYDVRTDPGEKNNIIFSHPDVASMLEKQLQSIFPAR